MRDRPGLEESSTGVRRCPSDSGEECVEAANRFVADLAHLDERWKQARLLDHATLIEQYLCGRLSIALYFEPAVPDANHVADASSIYTARDVSEPIAAIINSADAGNGVDGKNGQQQSVFVTLAEPVQYPQRIVRSFIRPHRVEKKFCNPTHGELYRSVPALAFGAASDHLRLGPEGIFEFLPAFAHREAEPCIFPAEDFVDGVVQGATQVVDAIPKQERKVWPKPLHGNDMQFLAAVRLILHDKFAEIRLDKGVPCGLKLANVFVGPLKL